MARETEEHGSGRPLRNQNTAHIPSLWGVRRTVLPSQPPILRLGLAEPAVYSIHLSILLQGFLLLVMGVGERVLPALMPGHFYISSDGCSRPGHPIQCHLLKPKFLEHNANTSSYSLKSNLEEIINGPKLLNKFKAPWKPTPLHG